MTDEQETVEAVVTDLVERGIVLPGEAHLAKLVGQEVVNRMRAEGQTAQLSLPSLSPVGSGLWL